MRQGDGHPMPAWVLAYVRPYLQPSRRVAAENAMQERDEAQQIVQRSAAQAADLCALLKDLEARQDREVSPHPLPSG